MNYEVGKTYLFTHERKGKFKGVVVEDKGYCMDVLLTEGTAHYLTQDDAHAGDTITVRKDLIHEAKEEQNEAHAD